MSLAQEILSNVVVRNWSDEELRALTRQLLTSVATYNGIAVRTSPALAEMLRKKPVTPGDSLRAGVILNSADYKTSVHVRPEAFVNTHGGKIECTPTTIRHVDLRGQVHEKGNAPVPLPYGIKEKYENLQAVSALCAQVVVNTQGNWVSAVNGSSWEKVYRVGINVPGMVALSISVAKILNQDRTWKAMSPIARSAVQGNEMLSFVATAMNELEESTYWTINTVIVLNALRAMERFDGGWRYVTDDMGVKVISERSYKRITEKTCSSLTVTTKLMILKTYPCVMMYLGGVIVGVDFPKDEHGTFKEALDSVARLREVQGSDSSCTALLAGMRDYSGLTDDFGKRVQFLVSAILAAWREGLEVDVHLSTIGDLPIVMSSVAYWRKWALDQGDNFFDKGCQPGKKCGFGVKYLLPQISDKLKVPGTLHPEVISFKREGTCYVTYVDGTLPSAVERGKPVDYESNSKILVPEFVTASSYIIYNAIYGDYPFCYDDQVVMMRRSSTVSFPVWEKRPYVYRFGTGSGFRGILSSIPQLNLVGFGVRPTSTGWDQSKLVLHDIELPLVKTQREWMKQVCKDCKMQAITFLTPVTRYSGISNLIVQSKVAAVLKLTMMEGEKGALYGNSVVRTVGKSVKDQVVCFEDEGEQPQPQDTSSSSSVSSTSSEKAPDPFQMVDFRDAVDPVEGDVVGGEEEDDKGEEDLLPGSEDFGKLLPPGGPNDI